MTSPNRVARAYVEITADYDKFAREAGQKINAALRTVGNNIDFDPLRGRGEAAGETFAKGIQEGIANEFRIGTARVAATIASAAESNTSRNRVSGAFRNLASFAASAFGAFFSNFLSSGISRFGDFFGEGLLKGFSALGEIFDKVGKGFGNFLIQAGIGIIVIPHLAGVIITLVANLTGLVALLALLPGTLAVVAGALVPLVVIFQNFGGAIQAVLDGDPEKIAEAMEKLTPAARGVVREIQKLLPYFRDLQRIAQQNFFSPLVGQLTSLFEILGKDKIAQGFANVSGALGNFFGLFFRAAESPAFLRLYDLLFGNKEQGGQISRILNGLAGPLQQLLESFATVAVATAPVLEKMFTALGGSIREFAEWLTAASEDGRMEKWLQTAVETAGDLGDLLGAILSLLGTIFTTTDDGGERFLQKVTRAIATLDEFFQSEDGKRALEAMVSLANFFADALILVAKILAQIFNLLGAIETSYRNSSFFQGGARAGVKAVSGFASGGIVSQPTFAMVGEAGPEAVVPLNDPKRAREVMAEAGLVPLAESMMGAGSTTVYVYLGTDQITDILDTRVQKGLAGTARALARKPR